MSEQKISQEIIQKALSFKVLLPLFIICFTVAIIGSFLASPVLQLLPLSLCFILAVGTSYFYQRQSKSTALLANNSRPPTSNQIYTQSKTPLALLVSDHSVTIGQIESPLKSRENTTEVNEIINITTSKTSDDALKVLKQKKFDLVLYDFDMPSDDALDNIAILRQQNYASRSQPRLPIVAISTHNRKEKLQDVLLAGADDLLSKPISAQPLYDIFNRWCGTHLYIQNDLHEDPGYLAPSAEANTPKTKVTLPDVIIQVVDTQQSLEYSHQNPQLARDLLSLLIQMVKSERDNVIDYLQQRDWEKLGELTHKIYGGCCYCGVKHLQETSLHADQLLQKQEYRNIDLAIDNLLTAMDELVLWDENYDIDIIFE